MSLGYGWTLCTEGQSNYRPLSGVVVVLEHSPHIQVLSRWPLTLRRCRSDPSIELVQLSRLCCAGRYREHQPIQKCLLSFAAPLSVHREG